MPRISVRHPTGVDALCRSVRLICLCICISKYRFYFVCILSNQIILVYVFTCGVSGCSRVLDVPLFLVAYYKIDCCVEIHIHFRFSV